MYMELGLGVIFDKYNIDIIGLDVFDQRAGNTTKSFAGYPFFTKIIMSKNRGD